MQALVYIFVLLTGAAVAAATYYGLTFTPIEAGLAAFVTIAIAVVMLERSLRRRSELRLERAVEDLSRLLSTDAQAGQVLSQRINEMTDVDAGPRIDSMEADMSVLGTVVRQVAEAVAELENAQTKLVERQNAVSIREDQMITDVPPAVTAKGDVAISVAEVREALGDRRITFRAQSIVTLPQRRIISHDLSPWMALSNGKQVEAAAFMPSTSGNSGNNIVREIEQRAWQQAFDLASKARARGQSLPLSIPLSRATLSDPDAVEVAIAQLDASRTLAKDISFTISDLQWHGLNPMERHTLSMLVEKDVGISITDARSLRLDFADLEANGVTAVRIDATRFINQPESYTDFHSADVADYVHRYGINLIVTGVKSEQQILSLLEDGVRYVQGDHISPPESADGIVDANTNIVADTPETVTS